MYYVEGKGAPTRMDQAEALLMHQPEPWWGLTQGGRAREHLQVRLGRGNLRGAGAEGAVVHQLRPRRWGARRA